MAWPMESFVAHLNKHACSNDQLSGICYHSDRDEFCELAVELNFVVQTIKSASEDLCLI